MPRALASGSASRSTPTARVEQISVGQQQRVEILKALYRGAEILILDEPTAVLTPAGGGRALRDHQRPDRRRGTSIIFISHKLNEVLEIADRITVLRRGKTDRHRPPRRARPRTSLARMMVGRDVLLRVEKTAGDAGRGRARGRRPPRPRRPRPRAGPRASRSTSAAGEIVAIAGVDGNGQSELIEAIAGLRARSRAADRGRRQRGQRHADRRARCSTPGIGHIPEDRHRRGLVLDFSLAENIALHDYDEAAGREASAGSSRSG